MIGILSYGQGKINIVLSMRKTKKIVAADSTLHVSLHFYISKLAGPGIIFFFENNLKIIFSSIFGLKIVLRLLLSLTKCYPQRPLCKNCNLYKDFLLGEK